MSSSVVKVNVFTRVLLMLRPCLRALIKGGDVILAATLEAHDLGRVHASTFAQINVGVFRVLALVGFSNATTTTTATTAATATISAATVIDIVHPS